MLMVLAALSAPAGAAVVRLKDGGSISGTIVSATAIEVVVRTASGPRSVAAARVQSIEYDAEPAPAAKPAPAAPSAPPPEEKNLFSLGLGLAAPQSDVDFTPIGGGSASNGDVGGLIGARYLRETSKSFAYGFDLDYFHRGATSSPGLMRLADASVSGDNLLLLAIARVHLIDRGPVRPYLLGGLGAGRSWTRIDAAPRPGFVWTDTGTDEARRLIDDGAWAFASTAKAGLDFDWEFASPTVFSLEAGWTGLSNRRYRATPAGRDLGLQDVSGRIDVFTLAMRWSWRW